LSSSTSSLSNISDSKYTGSSKACGRDDVQGQQALSRRLSSPCSHSVSNKPVRLSSPPSAIRNISTSPTQDLPRYQCDVDPKRCGSITSIRRKRTSSKWSLFPIFKQDAFCDSTANPSVTHRPESIYSVDNDGSGVTKYSQLNEYTRPAASNFRAPLDFTTAVPPRNSLIRKASHINLFHRRDVNMRLKDFARESKKI
jgi:hypothetical protein